MKDQPVIAHIDQLLRSLTGFKPELACQDFLMLSENRNELIVKETNGEAELLLCLQSSLLDRLNKMELPADFSPELLPDLSVVIEELSHFNMYCQRASEDRHLSGLEMEVQGEVDKFAVSLEWLHTRNEEQKKHEIFEIIFGELKLGTWVTEEDRSRYEDAHLIARNFCRTILEQNLPYEKRRTEFRSFFFAPAKDKLSPKI